MASPALLLSEQAKGTQFGTKVQVKIKYTFSNFGRWVLLEIMALEIIGGALFTLLYDGVKQAMSKSGTFKSLLRDLNSTLEALVDIQQIGELNVELGLPNEEIEGLKMLMEEGVKLVEKLSNLRMWNYCCLNDYTEQIAELNRALKRLLQKLKFQKSRDVKELLLLLRQFRDTSDELKRGQLDIEKSLPERAGDVMESSVSGGNAETVREQSQGNGEQPVTSFDGGTSLQAVFAVLFDVVTEVKDKTTVFQPFLEDIKSTLDILKPLIEEIAKHNKVLDRPKEELENFRNQMEKGVELIRKCFEVRLWSSCKQYKYTDKLMGLDQSLQKMLNILKAQVARDLKETLVSIKNIEGVIKKIEESGLVRDQIQTKGSGALPEPLSPRVGLDIVNMQGTRDVKEALVSGVEERFPSQFRHMDLKDKNSKIYMDLKAKNSEIYMDLKGKNSEIYMDLKGKNSEIYMDLKDKNSEIYMDLKHIVMAHALPYLPAKSLFRFRAVSKEWDELITSPFFIHQQSHHFRDISGLFCQVPGDAPFFVSLNGKAYGVPSPSLSFLPEPVTVRSSCNGLLCCQSCNGETTYYICNPATKEWRALPKSNLYHGPEPALALAFEPSVLNFAAHYQLICAFSLTDHPVICFEIFSSRSSSWRLADTECCELDASKLNGDGLFMKGVAFWETSAGDILSFDLNKEQYGILALPLGSGPHGALAEMHGELCYILPHRKGYYYNLDIYGDMDMNLKHSISLDGFRQFTGKMRALVCVNSDVVIVKIGRILMAYDVKAGKEKMLRSGTRTDGYVRYLPYVNSLVHVH